MQTVAAVVTQLHAVRPAELARLVEPYRVWCRRRREDASRGIAAVSGPIDPDLGAWLRAVQAGLIGGLGVIDAPTVVHGDLWHADALVREERLTEVLDREACAVGDPAVDLAGLWWFGNSFAQRLSEALGLTGPGHRR